jgi:hypothetical protein
LNQRSILLASDLFLGEKRGTKITLSELLEALWVLDLMIVSDGIYYDGTLPLGDQERLRRETEALTKDLRVWKKSFEPIMPLNKDRQGEWAWSAALDALDDLGAVQRIGQPSALSQGIFDDLDRPLPPEDAERLFRELEKHVKQRVSDDELMDMLGGSFRGSKCVAGILTLGADSAEAALDLPNQLNCTPELAGGALINRFRFSYLRQLSFDARHVYVPAMNWKRLSQFHKYRVEDVWRRNAQSRYFGPLSKDIEQHFNTKLGDNDETPTFALPPLGLYCLMKAGPKYNPRGVVELALETYADYGELFRNFWKTTRKNQPPVGGWTTLYENRVLDEVSQSIEQLLSDHLGKLEKAALGPSCNGSRVYRYLTAIVKLAAPVAGGLIGQIAEPSIGPVASFMLGASFGWGIEQGHEIIKGRMLRHFDQYRALDGELMRTCAETLRLDRLSGQVKAVLDRELTDI